jgi:hypothetical protein
MPSLRPALANPPLPFFALPRNRLGTEFFPAPEFLRKLPSARPKLPQNHHPAASAYCRRMPRSGIPWQTEIVYHPPRGLPGPVAGRLPKQDTSVGESRTTFPGGYVPGPNSSLWGIGGGLLPPKSKTEGIFLPGKSHLHQCTDAAIAGFPGGTSAVSGRPIVCIYLVPCSAPRDLTAC